ncbi:hypothetical protein T07_4414 [Trichinella nelsoni]|uniref:Uncharacterized protein n=1 Tax=Trichinella nelsoni TaxID=6336 RepID=A0A0V0SAK3_9BILA|nr:hypothetical protein T07_4414 [Trichinella nelsoni]
MSYVKLLNAFTVITSLNSFFTFASLGSDQLRFFLASETAFHSDFDIQSIWEIMCTHKIGNFTIIKNLYIVTIYIQTLALMQGTSSGERGGYKDIVTNIADNIVYVAYHILIHHMAII